MKILDAQKVIIVKNSDMNVCIKVRKNCKHSDEELIGIVKTKMRSDNIKIEVIKCSLVMSI
jgi:hypothetical protein